MVIGIRVKKSVKNLTAWFARWLFFTLCILVWHITQQRGREREDTAFVVFLYKSAKVYELMLNTHTITILANLLNVLDEAESTESLVTTWRHLCY